MLIQKADFLLALPITTIGLGLINTHKFFVLKLLLSAFRFPT